MNAKYRNRALEICKLVLLSVRDPCQHSGNMGEQTSGAGDEHGGLRTGPQHCYTWVAFTQLDLSLGLLLVGFSLQH